MQNHILCSHIISCRSQKLNAVTIFTYEFDQPHPFITGLHTKYVNPKELRFSITLKKRKGMTFLRVLSAEEMSNMIEKEFVKINDQICQVLKSHMEQLNNLVLNETVLNRRVRYQFKEEKELMEMGLKLKINTLSMLVTKTEKKHEKCQTDDIKPLHKEIIEIFRQ